MVSEDLASSSESEGEEEEEARQRMEPNKQGILEIETHSDDDLESLNGLFHWQMEDYEVFSCNMLQVDEGNEKQTFPLEYTEY